MNIVLDKYTFDRKNIFFTDTRKNMVLDGNFTKIIYSDFSFTMNSIYIVYPIFRYYIDKNILYFQLNEANNENINWFTSIEMYILNTYCKENNVLKQKLYSLHNQITTGKIKIYCNDANNGNENMNNNLPTLAHSNFVILKISGIWENAHNIGITYKFLYPA